MRVWLQVPVTRPHCQLRLVQAWVRGGDPPSGASEVGPAPRVTFGARRAAPALSRTRRPGSDGHVGGLILSNIREEDMLSISK